MQLHDMNPFAEIALIIFLTIIFMIVGKLLSNIKYKGRTVKIPVVISVVMAGFIAGLIIRSIDQDFSFTIVPYFSAISIILLFVAFGAMIDFKAFKKFGVWTILIGTIPYFIEWLALFIVMALLTPLLWMEAGIAACLIAMCAPGVISSKLMDNMVKGYEKESSYNETMSLAGAVENIFGLVIMIALVVFYQSHYIEGGIATGLILVLPFILLGIGLALGIVLALFSIKVLKPISHMIIPAYVKDTTNLSGEELEIANNLNIKSESKSNNLVWLFVAILFAVVYIIFQLVFGIGFIVMEAGLVAGLVISISGSKSLSVKNTQAKIAKNSNIFYGLIGCFVVWGFGGMLINPAEIVGNNWMSVNGTTNFMPNIVSAMIFICIGIVFRIIGIFTVMSFNPKYTLKQMLYTIPVMLSTGTTGVNNGVTIFLLLSISQSNTTQGQWENALILQNMLIVIGATMTFILIPIGVTLLEVGQNRLIFQWKGETEGSYKVKVAKVMSIENTENKNKVKTTIKEYWDSFYKEKKISSAYKHSLNKKINSLNIDLNYQNNILNKEKMKIVVNKHTLDEYIKSENNNLEYLKINSDEKEKLTLSSNSKIEKKRIKIDDKNTLLNKKIESIQNVILNIKNLISEENNNISKEKIPENVSKVKNMLSEKSKNLENIIQSSLKDENILKITKELIL